MPGLSKKKKIKMEIRAVNKIYEILFISVELKTLQEYARTRPTAFNTIINLQKCPLNRTLPNPANCFRTTLCRTYVFSTIGLIKIYKLFFCGDQLKEFVMFYNWIILQYRLAIHM